MCMAGPISYTPPPKPADCDLDWGSTIGLEGNTKATFACVGGVVYAGESSTPPWWQSGRDGKLKLYGYNFYTLGYGHILQNETYRCVVDKATGVTCQTLDGAHGFQLAMQKYKTW